MITPTRVRTSAYTLPVDRFFGRARELEAIGKARAEHRVVTLLGPPGIGKTRLLRAWLDDVRGDGGVFFCDLTAARTLGDLAAAVARALDVRLAEDVAGALADAGPVVVALDNLETIAEAAAETIADWCARAPECFFVVTSRVRLGAPGSGLAAFEHVIDVGPLDAARELFAARAQVAPPEALLRALDGIPLAIELAAARCRVLGASIVLERLQRGSEDILKDRTRSLRAAIQASWDLLEEEERAVLAQCSIFAGAFSVEAAEAVVVAASVLDSLAALVDHSLLRNSGDGTFSMFASIREFARAHVEDGDALAARHRGWILGYAEGLHAEFVRTGSSVARKALAAVKDELLVVGDDPLAILYLEPTLAVESNYEALIPTLERGIGLAAAAGRTDVQARLVMARGAAHGIRGRLVESLADFEAARDLATDPVIRAEALMYSGVRYRNLGRVDEARSAGELALQTLGTTDAPRVEGACRAVLGLLLFELGEAERSRISNLRARAIFDAAGDRWSEALPLANLAQLDQAAGEYEKSALEYDAALVRFREHGDRRYEARYLGYRAGLAHERRDFGPARALYATALELLSALRIAPTEGLFRACLAALEAEAGNTDAALEEMTRAEMLLATGAPPATLAALDIHRGHLDLALARTSDANRAAALVARAQQRLRDVRLADRSEDVRFAARLLARALSGAETGHGAARSDGRAGASGTPLLQVEPDARSFRVGELPAVDLTRRAALRHIVLALVEARGKPLSAEDLLAIGWPGEKVVGDAGGNRVRVAVSTLRRLGLASVLVTSDAGYFLESRAFKIPGTPV